MKRIKDQRKMNGNEMNEEKGSTHSFPLLFSFLSFVPPSHGGCLHGSFRFLSSLPFSSFHASLVHCKRRARQREMKRKGPEPTAQDITDERFVCVLFLLIKFTHSFHSFVI